ncbi:hypothetical protein D3C72_481050 [compost metagenome]
MSVGFAYDQVVYQYDKTKILRRGHLFDRECCDVLDQHDIDHKGVTHQFRTDEEMGPDEYLCVNVEIPTDDAYELSDEIHDALGEVVRSYR